MACLALLAVLPYVAQGGLRWFINLDDNEYVYENPVVRAGVTAAGFRWAFTSFHSGNWHPLTWISHMVDVALFGLDPRWHHASSIAVHGVSAAVLFLALWRFTGARWRSFVAAAIFAIHPLHVESVAWVAERKDVLSGLCFALALLAYERAVRRGGAAGRGMVFLAAAAGLLAKPMLVTLPFVLLLLDYWPLGRMLPGVSASKGRAGTPWPRLVVEKLPLFGLSAASCLLSFLAQRSAAAVADLTTLAPALRIANAATSVLDYLGASLWPARLAVYYPHPFGATSAGKLAAAILVVCGVSAAAAAAFRRLPWLAVGWLWFLGMLVPVLGIVQVGQQARADRYTYLPLIGLSLAVVWGLPHRRAAARFSSAATRVGAAAVIALFAAASVRQAGFWRDQETLYRHTLAVTSGNWVIESNLGAALIERGRYAEAEELLRASVRAQPGYSRLHNHLGVARAALGRLAEAETDYRNALALSPSFFDARYNLAGALVRQGRIAEAEATYRDALAIRPESVEAHFNLGNLLAGAGNTNEAIAQYRQALQFAPDAADVLNNLAWAILADPATSGRMGGEAVTRARRACELTGNRDPLYLDTLATAYAAVGDYAQAREVSARALAEARERKDVKLEQEILSRRDLLLATKPPAGQSGPGRAAANPLLR